ncbi:MAG: hypothetical protein LBU66_05580, partial [Treponema sp.]|nr:hypothetical protein [Treponema sp.]
MITPLSPDGELMRYATDTKTVEVKPGQTSSVVMSMTAIFCRGCDYHDLTEATCTEPGIAKITCEINDEHNKETEIHEALGHEWPEEWEIITPAECEIPGEKIKRCLRGPESCSDFEETGTEIETIEALEHEWEYDESANPPTCLLPGNGKRVCEACGEEEETGDYPALGHKWSDTIAASYCKVVDDVFVHGTGTN